VRRARVNTALLTQVAEFHQLRAHPKPQIQVASLTPDLPKLLALPKLVERLAPFGTRPTAAERTKLAELADAPLPKLVAAPTPAHRRQPAEAGAAWTAEMRVASADAGADAPVAGRLKWAATFVPAPAYDEEHPEELSYRPFPIAPFLTATASVDDPALARMVHPDLAKTLEMLTDGGSAPPMRLRPGSQTAHLMWAQQFKGEAINLSSLIALDAPQGSARLAERRVATQPQ
jgi:hypothetical protein